MCHVSCVKCHVLSVMCHMSHVIYHPQVPHIFFDKVIELVGGGSVFNGPTLSSLELKGGNISLTHVRIKDKWKILVLLQNGIDQISLIC